MNLELINEPIELPDCHPIAAYDDMTEEDWHKYRKTGIGGSEAPGIMSMSKYSSPLTVAMEKTGRIKPDDISQEDPIIMGNLMEPLIRNNIVKPILKQRLDLDVEVIDPTHMYRSDKYPWMIINMDGFLKIDRNIKNIDISLDDKNKGKINIDVNGFNTQKLIGLELKFRSSYMLQYYGGRDGNEVMDSDYCQVQHYMAGTGLDEFIVFAMLGSLPVIRFVPRNEEFITALVEEERKLWDIIQENNIMNFPAPNGSDADQKVIDQYSNPQIEDTIKLDQDEEKIKKHKSLGDEIKALTEHRKKLQQEILMDMGHHKFGETDNHVVTLSRFDQTRIDSKRLRIELPEIAEKYSNTTESSRFSVKER
jgi:predicted phage-related endonuclease